MKVMLVTGGGRGIGAATAKLAAQKGYEVVVNYHSNKEAAQNVVNAINNNGGTAIAVQADVSKEKDVKRLFDTIQEHFGKLDVLVNNAGILEKQSTFDKIEPDRLQRMMAVNVIGPMLCCRAAIPFLSKEKNGKGGVIVNVSSVAARTGSPNEYVDYASSKGAIDTLTIGLAKELAADGIRVNAVRPGFIYTDIHAAGGEPGRVDRLIPRIPLQRGGQAEEVAEAILWLASDQSSYSTGIFVDVTGGV